MSKLKSIKKFDDNNCNADKALVEINASRYGLKKRTGVDYQTFSNYTPGCLIDVYYGYNEVVDKSYIEKLELAPGTTLHKQTDTYI